MNLEPLSLHITPEAVLAYAHLTDDFNPIHLDAAFAAASQMKGQIAHGTLSLGVLWQALAQVPSTRPESWILDIRFQLPVRLGDRVTAGGSMIDADSLEVWVRNDQGQTVIAGVARQAR